MSFTVQKDVMVAMRDGVELATDAWIPAVTPAPTLLVRLPYGKDLPQLLAYGLMPNIFALVEAGYAVVYQDCRGTFRSGGDLVPMLNEAADGAEAVRLALALGPDVILMDLRMPGIDGLTAITELGKRGSAARVLVLTTYDTDSHVLPAIEAGATGYLLKDASVVDIVAGVRAAAADESMISPRMTKTLLDRLRRQERPDGKPPIATLSVREREILRLVTEGKDNATIAQELFISPYTVKNHISNILLKLHVSNRIQAAVLAVRDSLL